MRGFLILWAIINSLNNGNYITPPCSEDHVLISAHPVAVKGTAAGQAGLFLVPMGGEAVSEG